MRSSNFFADLSKTYQAEIEDHSTDSEGKDILRHQLKKKRSQIVELLPMIGFAPEMVALAFHQGINFPYPKVLEKLVSQEPDDFMNWGELAQSIDFVPWAQELDDRVLEEEGGEQFLIITAGLEFLHGKSISAFSQANSEHEDREDAGDGDANQDERGEEPGEGDEEDLEQAGAEWMAEQGFDRLN